MKNYAMWKNKFGHYPTKNYGFKIRFWRQIGVDMGIFMGYDDSRGYQIDVYEN